MPRYFFDVEGGRQTLDEDGEHLSGPDAARHSATVILSELLRVAPTDPVRIAVRVRDNAGKTLRVIEARDVD